MYEGERDRTGRQGGWRDGGMGRNKPGPRVQAAKGYMTTFCHICGLDIVWDFSIHKKREHEEKSDFCNFCGTEEFGEVFPVFLERNITRKMHSLAVIVPHFLRTKSKFLYKISKVEQNRDHLHKDFNDPICLYKDIIEKSLKRFLKTRKYDVGNSTYKKLSLNLKRKK